ncbi:MAG TPA: hypothetical protein VKF62_11685 [Planctomycetota bacterium]|nr:hypothetical protein [Planctomycetota bacterium]
MRTTFFLSVEAAGVRIVAGLNDVPLLVGEEPGGIVSTEPVQVWLKPAGNRLTVELSWPPDRAFLKGTARAEVTVFVHDPSSEAPKPAKVLARFRWPVPGVEEEYPRRHEERVEDPIPDPPPTLLWKEAAPIGELGSKDRTAILALVKKLHSALARRAGEEAFSLLQYRYEEEARAEGKPLERVRRAILDTYDWMFGTGELVVFPPLDPHSARFRRVADDRLVLVDRKDGLAAVYFENPAEGLAFGIPVYAARVRGEWRIAR